MTQNQKILAALRKGRTLTQLDCFKLCGTLGNAHKRMAEINTSPRHVLPQGSWVTSVWVKRNGKKFRAWKLA